MIRIDTPSTLRPLVTSGPTTSPTAAVAPPKPPAPTDAPWVQDAQLNGKRFGDLLDKQYRFRFTREGDASRAVPVSSGAMLRASLGSSIVREAEAAKHFVERAPGPGQLDGYSVSTSKDGYIANAIAIDMEDASSPLNQREQFPKAFAEAVRRYSELFDQDAPAFWNNGWINLAHTLDGPTIGMLSKEESGAFKALVLRHELEHAVTPMDLDLPSDEFDSDFRKLKGVNWLEEGLATTLAMWPGQIDEMIREAGLPGSKSLLTSSPNLRAMSIYPPFRATVQGLLEIAGISTSDPASHAAADQVLQGASVLRVPGRLADRIVEKYHLPVEDSDWVRTGIAKLGGDPAKLAPFLQEIVARGAQRANPPVVGS